MALVLTMLDSLPVHFMLLALLSSAAGFVGALLGLGGGIILVPGLTLLFGLPVKIAIAASLISVIATSTSAATVYVSERFTNIRLGMLLEVFTTIGAMIGGIAAVYIGSRYLYFLFAAVLVYSGFNMLRRRAATEREPVDVSAPGIHGSYRDPSTHKTISYTVEKLPIGMLGSTLAGLIAGMLGVGGGIIKVPLMNTVMRVPLKAAIGTSNFMIGITAAVGAFVYWTSGLVHADIAAPTVVGVLIGARIGTKVAGRAHTRALTIAFVTIIAVTAVQMVMKGLSAGGAH